MLLTDPVLNEILGAGWQTVTYRQNTELMIEAWHWIAKEWVQPVDAALKLFKAASDVKDEEGNLLVTAYPVQRPDGRWSVMLINKDQSNDHAVRLAFADSTAKEGRAFSGSVDQVVFGAAEYQWHPDAASTAIEQSDVAGQQAGRHTRIRGHASPDGQPSRLTIEAGVA